MKEAAPRTIYLKDYEPPVFILKSVDLFFLLQDDGAEVGATLVFARNPADESQSRELKLDGEKLELLELKLDGELLAQDQYLCDHESLTLYSVPDEFILETRVKIYPENNTELEGLFLSSGNYCTQCEAQGFRKITYYPDRPDIMTVFTTTIEADKEKYPLLLCNGNPIDRGDAEGGRHWVKWHDPHQKPSYLFALVAGDLACTRDHFVTQSGRDVSLEIYTEAHNADKTDHAMQSLKRAMRWDEKRFGLEYDLDIYMVVAVDDFNMGAMENKGLNVFNSKYVLATQKTATDDDFVAVEAVIAHEYFHNWTGNRVTCRDWFQLSLKEGLTVFRDQEFTADMTSVAVKRIDDVRHLRTSQFAEDASPIAHPVRPDSFIEINNFYTWTVYEKGAEVVRMYQTLLGRDGFRKGMDLYFQRHDGSAVTVEDFLAAMADANQLDLKQFQLWYEHVGTPKLNISSEWNAVTAEYRLTVSQSLPEDKNPQQKPLMIPLKFALLDQQGNDIALPEEKNTHLENDILLLTKMEETFIFQGLADAPVPSLLRGFSAPVQLEFEYSSEQLAFLMMHDNDEFNRWDASQKLASTVLLRLIQNIQQGNSLVVDRNLESAFEALLQDDNADPALLAEALTLPSEIILAEQMEVIDVDAIHQAREFLRMTLGKNLQSHWDAIYQRLQGTAEYKLDALSMGQRRMKNIALDYLLALNNQPARDLAMQQFNQSSNMTDSIGALKPLLSANCQESETALKAFHDQWRDDSLVMDKWFAMQATVARPDTLLQVRKLMDHSLFSLRNPNKVRSLIGAFIAMNPVCFHASDGSGYAFAGQQLIALDPLNPQIASRLAKGFSNWRKYDANRQSMMKAVLQDVLEQRDISRDVYEVVERSLES